MYQLTIQDLQLQKYVETSSPRTAFIDETGNFGFDFESPGTSKYYIICAVCIKDSEIDNLEFAIEKVRKHNFDTSEMKSSSIGSNYKRRSKIVAELLPLEFRVIILVANKEEFNKDSPLTIYKQSFVKYLHKRLYDVLYNVYPKLKIIEDQTGTSEFQVGFKKYIQENRPQYNMFDVYDFDYADSKNNLLIQLADVVAGTICKSYIDPASPNYLEMLKGKIIRIECFPNNIAPYSTLGNPEEIKFNKDIFDLSIRCANNFIEHNKANDDYDKRIQIAFLKYLLFQIYNVSSTKFVSSSQIVSMLSEYDNNRISKDFLYRRIVAHLRDSGVIIASCTQGYKIPTCVADIYTYLNQTNSLMAPMLHRLEICRKLILHQTDGELDVFENDSFLSYKKYFD